MDSQIASPNIFAMKAPLTGEIIFNNYWNAISTITCSNKSLALNLSQDGGENTACEAHAKILLAPSFFNK